MESKEKCKSGSESTKSAAFFSSLFHFARERLPSPSFLCFLCSLCLCVCVCVSLSLSLFLWILLLHCRRWSRWSREMSQISRGRVLRVSFPSLVSSAHYCFGVLISLLFWSFKKHCTKDIAHTGQGARRGGSRGGGGGGGGRRKRRRRRRRRPEVDAFVHQLSFQMLPMK